VSVTGGHGDQGQVRDPHVVLRAIAPSIGLKTTVWGPKWPS
jgi:hypothetical protein